LAKGTSIRLAQERLVFAASGKQHTTTGFPRNINIGKIGTIPSVDVACMPSTSDTIDQQKSPSIGRRQTNIVEGIEPLPSKKSSNEMSSANPVLERKLSAKKRRTEDLARIKDELRNAKLPSMDDLARKKAREKKKEEMEEAQAKSTVDAVSAAFNQGISGSGPTADSAGNRPKTSIAVLAAKPPASPSMLARRELNRLANRRDPEDEQQQKLQPPTQLPHSHSGSARICGGGSESISSSVKPVSPSISTRPFGRFRKAPPPPPHLHLVAVPIDQELDSPPAVPNFRR
jgi:hypothetical protein